LKNLLKKAREEKNFKTRELAQLLGIDQALVSKFESGSRKPTKEQVIKLAAILEIDYETIMITWLKEKIIYEIGDESLALKALEEAQKELKNSRSNSLNTVSAALQKLLDNIALLKTKLDKFRQFESHNVIQAIDLEYTFNSNRLEGNTLTFQETDLVINQGLTIPGKTMKEHLEIINHIEALAYVKGLVEKNIVLNEKELLSIHYILARGIQLDDAGRYRKTEVNIRGINNLSPHPQQITKEIEDFFMWYESHKNTLHPIIVAAEMHLRIHRIRPFTTSNGKTERLLQNYVLLQHGYVFADIKGDDENRLLYQLLLAKSQNSGNKENFLLFVAKTEKESLERYLERIAQ
jgi:Fic family protein/DNA-binding XRE family transcriptional regulator